MPRKAKAHIESPEPLIADGKSDEVVESAKKPKNLQELFGFEGHGNRYKTSSEEEYSLYISELGNSDLRTHAEKIGLNWISDRAMVKQRLMREFRKYWQQFQDSGNTERKFDSATEAKIRKALQG